MSTVQQPRDAASGLASTSRLLPWWQQPGAGATPDPVLPWTPAREQTAEQLTESIDLMCELLALPELTNPFVRARATECVNWLDDLRTEAMTS